ncbi:hypothetical protein ABHD20_25155, partial [Enterobacter cloacae]|uniref:hypothetical protein n=1 Tax=Enterobacter cloacae TaxID=550 RepID=UPI00325A8AF4
VKSNFAGRGMYMPQSIKRDSVPANFRNREAVTLALEGRYVQYNLFIMECACPAQIYISLHIYMSQCFLYG